MKKIKILSLILFVFVLNSKVTSQDYKNDLQGIKKVSIIMSGSTDIKVKPSESNGLLIHSDDFEEDDDREGLRAIYANGYDNSNLGLSVEKEQGVLIIRKLKSMSSDDYVFFIPSDMPFSLKNVLSGEISIEGFSSEIEVKTLSGDIILKDVTGPILANSTSGTIVVEFESVAQQNPMSFVSVSGDIELNFPQGSHSDLTMQTMSGTAYTNVDDLVLVSNKPKQKEKKKKKKKNIFGFEDSYTLCDSDYFGFSQKIKAKLNGGGVEILTKTVSGDIIIKED